MTGTTLRIVLQYAYRHLTPPGCLLRHSCPVRSSGADLDRLGSIRCPGEGGRRRRCNSTGPNAAHGPVPAEDRFQLKAISKRVKFRFTTFLVGKDGAKIKLSEDSDADGSGRAGSAATRRTTHCPARRPVRSSWAVAARIDLDWPESLSHDSVGRAAPITTARDDLQRIGRPVMDKTNLKGLLIFKIQFSSEGLGVSVRSTPGPQPGRGWRTADRSALRSVPSLFTVIQELGLRLESTKGPIEVLVIENVQKPAEN